MPYIYSILRDVCKFLYQNPEIFKIYFTTNVSLPISTSTNCINDTANHSMQIRLKGAENKIQTEICPKLRTDCLLVFTKGLVLLQLVF